MGFQFQDPKTSCEHLRTDELLRALLVLSLCTFQRIVQHIARLLLEHYHYNQQHQQQKQQQQHQLPADGVRGTGPAAAAAPLLAWLRDALYRHFCAGAAARDVWTVMNRLRANNVGAVLEWAEEPALAGFYEEREETGASTPADAAHQPTDSPPAVQPPVAARSLRSATTPASPPSPWSVSARPTAAAAAAEAPYESLRTMPLCEYRGEELCQRRAKAADIAIDAAAMTAGALPSPVFCALKLPALGDARLLEKLSAALGRVTGLFRQHDPEGSGFVSQADFDACYERLAPQTGPAAPLVALELSRLFIEDSSGRVDYVSWVQRLQLPSLLAAAEQLQRLTAATGVSRGDEGESSWPMSEQEHARLRELLARLNSLADRAVSKGVKLLIDAEHGSLRPAVEHITHGLMRRYNRARAGHPGGPAAGHNNGGCEAAVFATYQAGAGLTAYLRDAPQRLAADLARAERQGYTLGAKLVGRGVCGAYLPLELRWAADACLPPPVWSSAAQTHASFDACAELLLAGAQRGGAEVMLATNNPERVAAAQAAMAARGLAPTPAGDTSDGDCEGCSGGGAPVYFAQLLGVSDALSFALGDLGYRVYKFVPYGEQDNVVPYLADGKDLRLVQAELLRRLADACRAFVAARAGAALAGRQEASRSLAA
ncbi:hypothetical protein GPECTOR_33g602 [Gonium pectorale]|uniref:Proline dehydrogenase n=1 Tax=Gonium pectorale TaxID=33097 RepID=A0A150GEE2_GONPE|nr:hypothetical protein GPECTOR_33g602 [Gonium pectorale]|eukprot:KXZ47720.1 hypothetical protein GPECTOR_33g602 [Gonium pectorale]